MYDIEDISLYYPLFAKPNACLNKYRELKKKEGIIVDP
jgi:hypothetical protein